MIDYCRKLIVPVTALLVLAMSAGVVRLSQAGSPGAITDPVKEIAGYRSWTKVNARPQLMQLRTARDCVMVLTPRDRDVNSPDNPHQEKYITVYVNAIGRQSMMEKLRPEFPKGSVIVKEKLPHVTSDSPELLTVMIKREKGFNPANGDWEFMVVDGSGTKVEGRGKLENCQGCHVAKPQTDYIFRSYLSDDTSNALK